MRWAWLDLKSKLRQRGLLAHPHSKSQRVYCWAFQIPTTELE